MSHKPRIDGQPRDDLFCDWCHGWLARRARYNETIFWDEDQKRQINLHRQCYEPYKQALILKARGLRGLK